MHFRHILIKSHSREYCKDKTYLMSNIWYFWWLVIYGHAALTFYSSFNCVLIDLTYGRVPALWQRDEWKWIDVTRMATIMNKACGIWLAKWSPISIGASRHANDPDTDYYIAMPFTTQDGMTMSLKEVLLHNEVLRSMKNYEHVSFLE